MAEAKIYSAGKDLIMMKRNRLIPLSLLIAMVLSPCIVMAQTQKQLVRLAVIEVDSAQLDRYTEFLKEEIEASIGEEPGVITLYGVAEKENQTRVTLFETYADSSRYREHLTTRHFQKYKQGTMLMVEHLDLIEAKSILYIRKPELSTTRSENYIIRLTKMEIESDRTDDFHKLVNTVMLPGLKTEPGVLVMYAVAQKNRPTHISILEVYADAASYEKHLKTSHFIKYKAESKAMIKSLTRVGVNPILLGAKP
jgi:4-carboxymuconolactone decarboxylase